MRSLRSLGRAASGAPFSSTLGMQMRHLGQYKLYLTMVGLVAAARWALTLLMLMIFTAQIIQLPAVAREVSVGCIVFLTATAFGALGISIFLRCPSCGKRMAVTWKIENPESHRTMSMPWRKQIFDFFLPSEIVSREVFCAHCATRYCLRSHA